MFPGLDEGGLALVSEAYDIASAALAGRLRGNGGPFIEHPLAVAKIAYNEVGLPAECVAAVFLHEAARVGTFTTVASVDGSSAQGSAPVSSVLFPEPVSPAALTAKFGKDITTMVEGLNKISTISPKDTRLEAENYKKLIVSYSRDPRVIVLKLADRLEVMRSLAMFPKQTRERKVLETLMLYIPLAHQLGLYNMKSEMEDIYFAHAEPEQYRTITNKLKSSASDRQRLMSQFIEPLKQTLSNAGISYKLKIRTKTAYSIWRKMQKQDVPFEGVYDVFAIRFIIDCEGDAKAEKDVCWDVYSYVTAEYEADNSRLRDWLSKPKPNGYESLHITVKNRDGAYLEVQIRTKRMDDIAESGLASHWSYKGVRSEAKLDGWLTSVRNILEHPSAGDYELPATPFGEIFVFTPTGELRHLPQDATVLDFAFDIHTNLGMRCVGAKVNGKAVSIREKLNTGDVVEILSGKNQKPSSDWLNFTVTSKARARIKRYFSEIEYARETEGRELLERRLKNWKLELTGEQLSNFMNKRTPYKTLTAFYGAVGDGTIDIAEIRNYLKEEEEKAASASRGPDVEAGNSRRMAVDTEGAVSDEFTVIGAKDIRGLDFKFAKCCNPVFGDDVFGFVSIKDGIKIHRLSCPNASRLIDMYPYRIRKVRWSGVSAGGSFQVGLRIVAEHDASVVNAIMDVVSSFKASVRSFNVVENERLGTYDINMRISVPSNLELDKVISKLRNLRSVSKVSRL